MNTEKQAIKIAIAIVNGHKQVRKPKSDWDKGMNLLQKLLKKVK